MDITNIFNNPVGEVLSAYTGVMGIWFYAGLLSVIGVYMLIKTESWHAGSATFVLMAVLFSFMLPAYVVFLWSIAVALSFTFLIIDVVVLK